MLIARHHDLETHRLAGPRRILLAFVLPLALGCQVDPTGSEAISCTTESLYGGTTDSGPLDFSIASRAIVGVESSGGSLVCTGTFVAPAFVLTAAHCALASGLWVRTSPVDVPLAVVRTLRHPELDAMLLDVGSPAGPDYGQRPTLDPWPTGVGGEWVGRFVTLSGRGRTENATNGELHFTEEPVTDITETEIWVDGRGKSGACDGDSGGPLLARDSSGRIRILGILSRGSSTCLGVDVYTRVDLLAPWLAQLAIMGRRCGE